MLGSIRSEIIVAKWLRYHRSAMHIVCGVRGSILFPGSALLSLGS
jgi:hypothetical protein